MNKTYRIAELTLRLAEPHFRFAGLAPFEVDPATVEEPTLELRFDEAVATPTPDARPIDTFDFPDANAICRLYTAVGGHLFRMQVETGADVRFFVPESGVATCNYRPDGDRSLFRFGLWMAFNLRAARHGALAIHSSVLVHDGGAVLCLGESGTGKSTHTRLWREHIAGTELLNDDSPIIRITEGEARVYGSPWSGKTPCYRNLSYPIRGIIRLSQGPANVIRALTTLGAYGALQPSMPPSFLHDTELFEYENRLLSELLRRVKVYHLSCLPNAEAAELARNTLYNA
ncbi:MAG: hypothetical protein Q4A18_00150 [Rikenellaceae bacterium]|nr:hypothetical protein [Rikenellaceae bacterium]